jgi:hypothetical protein
MWCYRAGSDFMICDSNILIYAAGPDNALGMRQDLMPTLPACLTFKCIGSQN